MSTSSGLHPTTGGPNEAASAQGTIASAGGQGERTAATQGAKTTHKSKAPLSTVSTHVSETDPNELYATADEGSEVAGPGVLYYEWYGGYLTEDERRCIFEDTVTFVPDLVF